MMDSNTDSATVAYEVMARLSNGNRLTTEDIQALKNAGFSLVAIADLSGLLIEEVRQLDR